jgi:2,3-bisphosphoglycerate-independent phosphoglycerate mutase
MKTQKKALLIIMDGWGLGKIPAADAIQNADTQFVKALYSKYPNSTLITCGTDVGLPEGQMGNSEVGHLNLGAGRIVYQELERINVAIRDESFFKNEALVNAINFAKENKKPLHIIGLLSDGGVHSHITHVKAICTLCKKMEFDGLFIHVFTDGRDTDPTSAIKYITDLQNHLNETTGTIATVTGRYYAMDRDNRWERVALAYNAMVNAEGEKTENVLETIIARYAAGETDEFIKPIICVNKNNEAIATIKDGDALLCFNFRTDRCREISKVLTQIDMPEFGMKKLNVNFTTFTEYDKTFTNVGIMFYAQDLTKTIGQIIAENNCTQLRMAETEKYPHVSFFFSGGRELPFTGENRIMEPSPKDVATYDLKPEMSAPQLTEKLLFEINNTQPDFICINFANADMVGHTGVWSAAIKAVETVNNCVEKIVPAALAQDYTIFLTADHGNSDYMINEDGSPNTAHTLNLVPLFLISNWYQGPLKSGKLADVAPSILYAMDLPIPSEMTGTVLLDSSITN